MKTMNYKKIEAEVKEMLIEELKSYKSEEREEALDEIQSMIENNLDYSSSDTEEIEAKKQLLSEEIEKLKTEYDIDTYILVK